MIVTVALGTLDKTEKRQHSAGREIFEIAYVVDGAIMNADLASSDERP